MKLLLTGRKTRLVPRDLMQLPEGLITPHPGSCVRGRGKRARFLEDVTSSPNPGTGPALFWPCAESYYRVSRRWLLASQLVTAFTP